MRHPSTPSTSYLSVPRYGTSHGRCASCEHPPIRAEAGVLLASSSQDMRGAAVMLEEARQSTAELMGSTYSHSHSHGPLTHGLSEKSVNATAGGRDGHTFDPMSSGLPASQALEDGKSDASQGEDRAEPGDPLHAQQVHRDGSSTGSLDETQAPLRESRQHSGRTSRSSTAHGGMPRFCCSVAARAAASRAEYKRPPVSGFSRSPIFVTFATCDDRVSPVVRVRRAEHLPRQCSEIPFVPEWHLEHGAWHLRGSRERIWVGT